MDIQKIQLFIIQNINVQVDQYSFLFLVYINNINRVFEHSKW